MADDEGITIATLNASIDSVTSEKKYNKSTDGAANVSGLASNGVLQSVGTYSATDVLGYKVLAQGSADWSITLKDGSALTIPFASMIVGDILPEHLVSITVGTAGQALLYIPS